jgi:hypothetical protein
VRVVLVSGADANYFALLSDLIRSIRERIPRDEIDLAVLDAGLTGQQREVLAGQVESLAEPAWDVRPQGKAPAYVRLLESRPFLPRYFPRYDLYVWIDADAWLQDPEAIELLVRAAGTGALAIVPELHPAYDPVLPDLRLRYRMFGRLRFESWAHRHYRDSYGEAAARAYALRPLLNNGVFALRGDAPHWAAWIDSYRLASPRRYRFGLDQIALNHAVYSNELEAEYLPAWCNWTCSRGLPGFDTQSGLLVDPYLPHHPIGILHMTWRTKDGMHELETTNGGKLIRSLRFHGEARA